MVAKIATDLVDIYTLEGMVGVLFVEEETVKKREWSQLPSELLELIVENFVTISDFIRFRSVCTSWRKAATPQKLRPQPPILLLNYDELYPERYFFSIATGRTHCISLPQLVGKEIFDTANGWMLLFDGQTQELSIHNPVSLASIQLPPADMLNTIKCGRIFYDQFSDDFVVVIQVLSDTRLWFSKVRDESWSELKFSFDFWFDFLKDLVYHKGKFFAIMYGFIYINDASADSSRLPACSTKDISEFLHDAISFFVTANGQLFLVSQHIDKGFALYKMDSDGQQIKWSKVQTEDYAIFYSSTASMFCVKDFPRYNKNCT